MHESSYESIFYGKIILDSLEAAPGGPAPEFQVKTGKMVLKGTADHAIGMKIGVNTRNNMSLWYMKKKLILENLEPAPGRPAPDFLLKTLKKSKIAMKIVENI